MEAKVVQVGNSLGIILPKEALSRMEVGMGDILHLTESPDGWRVTTYDPAFEQQMAQARGVMNRRRAVLRELAK